MILKLKMELDKSTKKNKEYESLIENYKKEITNENENNIKDNEENNKILKELEMWKREYCKLLEESMGENYETKILNDELFNNNNNDKNLIEKKQYERPQTATIKNNISTEFEQLFEEINNVKNSKNIFDDVLNEESDDEEEENEDNENNDNIINDNNKNDDLVEEETPQEEDDGIPDDEIEEMFRKSCQNIQKMRQDLKDMNESIKDKNNNNYKKVINTNNNKMTIKPVIVKKESNSINSNVFNKDNATKSKLPNFHKNITENNKTNVAKIFTQ